MEQDIDVWAMIEEKNQKMRECIEKIEKNVSIPRRTISLLNQKVNECLMALVQEFKPEGDCCFLVKNLTPSTNVCFVHKITESERVFENIELSKVPNETKIGDVLVFSDKKLVISPFVTCEVLKIKQRILQSLENSIEDFQNEDEVYIVCDKSDDITEPKFSLRTQNGEKEFWGIGIDVELYNQVEYGTNVKFKNGKYVVA